MDHKIEMLTSQELVEIDALMKRATLQGVEAFRMVELSEKIGRMHRQALQREQMAVEPPEKPAVPDRSGDGPPAERPQH